jgi:hypothetical protein
LEQDPCEQNDLPQALRNYVYLLQQQKEPRHYEIPKENL